MNREELLKIAKPILFNTEMVQAILEGRKSVTRRVVKYYNRTPQMNGKDKFNRIDENLNGNNPNRLYAGFYNDNDIFYIDGEKHIDGIYYPLYFKVGDILYVRETWQCINPYSDKEYVYKASCDKDYASDIGKWLPSIHMPKKIARIFLKVTDVRVERVQDITEEQAIKEGVGNLFLDYIANYPGDKYKVSMEHETLAIDQFELLWDSINKKRGYGWNANPWVWTIEFERVKEG